MHMRSMRVMLKLSGYHTLSKAQPAMQNVNRKLVKIKHIEPDLKPSMTARIRAMSYTD